MDTRPADATLAPRWQKPVLVLTVALPVLLGLALSWHTTSDLDLPLHDRTGRDILTGQGIPQVNLYSFTAPGHPWLNHEWAFQVLVAAAGSATGRPGAEGALDLSARVRGWQILHLLLVAGLFSALVLQWRCESRRGQFGRHEALILLGPLALVALAMLWTRLILRPELVSYSLFVLVFARVEASLRDADRTGANWRSLLDSRRPAGQALLLTVLWYQMHGFALLAAVLWMVGGLFARSDLPRRARWQLAGGGGLLALLAGVISPGGLQQLLYPLRVLAQFGDAGIDLQATISEMEPLLETRDSLALTLTVFKISLVWAGLWIIGAWTRLSRLRLAIFLLAVVAALQAQRNLGFYAIAFLLLHGDLAPRPPAVVWRRLVTRLPDRPRRYAGAGLKIAVPVVTLVLATVWLASIVSDRFYLQEGVARRWGGGLAPANYPLQQATILAGMSPLRVANNVNAASTLVAARAGPVAIDGRTEAYPAQVWRDYGDLLAGQARSRQRLRAWRAEAVCLAHRSPASRPLLRLLLADPDWRLVSVDPAGALFLPAAAKPAAAGAEADPALVAGSRAVLRQAAADLRAVFDAAATGRDVRLADRGVSLAALLQLADEGHLAEELLLSSLARCPDHPAAHHNLGNLLLARGDLRGALLRFQAAARLNRNSALPLINAGNCLFQLGRPREAERALARAVARDPRTFEGWANLAEVRRQLGDRRGAARAYERALELRPGDQRLRARFRTL